MSLPNTSYYLPKSIRSLDLNDRISTLMDYIKATHHDGLISHPSGKWDASSPNYDPSVIVEELSGSQYLKHIQSGEDLTALSRMLTGLYNMKGSIRALQMILNILDIRGTIVTYFQVQRAFKLNTEQGKIWQSSPDHSNLQPCEVLVTLEVDATSTGLDASHEVILAELIDIYLWSCTKLAAILVIRYANDTMYTLIETEVEKELEKTVVHSMPSSTSVTYSSGLKYSTGIKHSVAGVPSSSGLKDAYDATREIDDDASDTILPVTDLGYVWDVLSSDEYIDTITSILSTMDQDSELTHDNEDTLEWDRTTRFSLGLTYSSGRYYTFPGTSGAGGIKDAYDGVREIDDDYSETMVPIVDEVASTFDYDASDTVELPAMDNPYDRYVDSDESDVIELPSDSRETFVEQALSSTFRVDMAKTFSSGAVYSSGITYTLPGTLGANGMKDIYGVDDD